MARFTALSFLLLTIISTLVDGDGGDKINRARTIKKLRAGTIEKLLGTKKSKCPKGKNCSGTKWVVMGDSDPHITAFLRDCEIDRPICYSLDGNDGEIYSIYEISNGLSVTAQLVASPRQQHPGATYFGKLTFATKKTKIEITPADVAVHDLKADSVVVLPWRHWVSHSNPTFFGDVDQDFSVVHFKRKVIKISYRGSEFEVKKNLLRFGAEKSDFFYLGIYLTKDIEATYGGIIGEMVDAKATWQLVNNRDSILFGDKTIQVIDKRQKDYLNNREFKCWMVENIEDLLKNKLVSYRRKA